MLLTKNGSSFIGDSAFSRAVRSSCRFLFSDIDNCVIPHIPPRCVLCILIAILLFLRMFSLSLFQLIKDFIVASRLIRAKTSRIYDEFITTQQQ